MGVRRGDSGRGSRVRVHLRADVLEEHDGPMLRHGLQELHGAGIQTPRRSEHLPNGGYPAERFNPFLAA